MPNAKGLHYGSEVIKNREIAKILYDIGELLELSGESKFKALAYKKASKSIELLTQDIEVVCNQGRLRNIPGIGIATEKWIIEYIRKGCVEYHKSLICEILPESRELLQISCIGPKMSHLLYENLKISSIEDLLMAAKAHQIQFLLGSEGEAEVIRVIEEYKERSMHDCRVECSLGQELTRLCFSEKYSEEGLHLNLILKLQKFLDSIGYNTTREYSINFRTVRRRDLKKYSRQGYIDLYAEQILESNLFYMFQKDMQSALPPKIAIEFDTGIRLKYKSLEKLIQSEAGTCFGIVKGNSQYDNKELIMRNKERFFEVKDSVNLFQKNFYLISIENNIFYDLTSQCYVGKMK